MWQFLSNLSRKALVISAIVLGVVVLTGIGLAAAAAIHPSSSAAAQSAQAASAPLMQNSGRPAHLVQVTAINGSTLTVTAGVAAQKGRQVTLTISSATKITSYGQPATLADIQVGDYLLVAGKDAQHISRIAILGAGAAGTIQAINTGGLTLQTKKQGTITVAVSSSTKIVEGGVQISLSDLQPHETIAVFGAKQSDGSLSAKLIHVRLVRGQVTAINGSAITIMRGAKGATGTVTTSSATRYYVAGQEVPASTLQVGDQIGVAGPVSAKTSVTATAIFIRELKVRGRVTSVNGDTFTMLAKDGTTWTITVSSATKYLQDGQPAALSDVQRGSLVEVTGLKSGDDALTASIVRIHAPKK
jgi:hypothetical protein